MNMYIKLVITAVLLVSICYASTNLHPVHSHDVQPYTSINTGYRRKLNVSKIKTRKTCSFFKAFRIDTKCLDNISLEMVSSTKQHDIGQNISSDIQFEYSEYSEKFSVEAQNLISKNETSELYTASIAGSKILRNVYSAAENTIDSNPFNSDINVDNHLIITENRQLLKREAEDYYDQNETSHNGSDLATNETESEEDYLRRLKDFIFPKAWTWVLIFFHTAVFVIGLVGNTLVCVAVYRNHTMRTVTNYFIVNLAVADFLVILLCLPPSVIWDVTMTWFLGVVMCKIVLYLQVSVFLL